MATNAASLGFRQSVSASGLTIYISSKAGGTAPFSVTGYLMLAFSRSREPMLSTSRQIGDAEMGMDGTVVTWGVPSVAEIAFSVVPGSIDDQLLEYLFDNNQPMAKQRDKLTLRIVVPSTGAYRELSNVTVNSYETIWSAEQSGKLAPRLYKFNHGDSDSTLRWLTLAATGAKTAVLGLRSQF